MDIFWETRHWEKKDRHLVLLSKMPFQRKWPFIPKAKGLYIIRGPRQIGKTSWLKSILSHHVPSQKSFYLSCEEMTDFRELSALLKSLVSTPVILLDEISFIDGWDRAIKHFIDSGYKGIVCVSGSHAYDLEKGVDSMPGRFDGGGEFYLLPMDFFEFQVARQQAGWRSKNHLEELRAYFRCGGFPSVVAAGGPEGKRSKASMSTYLRWLRGDAKKLGKDPDKLEEILIQLALIQQTPVSFQTLAKKTSIGSPNTVIDYIQLLESSFAVKKLFSVDLNTGSLQFRKDKKFYFTDPLLYWIARDLSGVKRPGVAHEEAVAEGVAHEHLSRKFSRFGFHRSAHGEIDFVSPKHWCVEVKWAPAATNLSRSFYDLVTPQKMVWTQETFLREFPV